MNVHFPEIKKNFGFGCMRFPMVDGQVDMEETKKNIIYKKLLIKQINK